MTQHQLALRTCDADVKQANFFILVVFTIAVTHKRNQPFLDARNEYAVELQTFTRVHGHKFDRVSSFFFLALGTRE